MKRAITSLALALAITGFTANVSAQIQDGGETGVDCGSPAGNAAGCSATVPEPSTLLLFSLGIAALGWKRRKKS